MNMKRLDEFVAVLGEPLRPAETAVLESLGTLWGVTLPEDFLAILYDQDSVPVLPTPNGLVLWGGTIEGDWLPEWEPLPHDVTEWGENPFAVLSMGAGPAGASLNPDGGDRK